MTWNTVFNWFYSLDMFNQANEVVKANNLSDTVIVLHGRVEVGFHDQANMFSRCLWLCSNSRYALVLITPWIEGNQLMRLKWEIWRFLVKLWGWTFVFVLCSWSCPVFCSSPYDQCLENQNPCLLDVRILKRFYM